MTIKKLQNNFTTPEQSKRLLELGVPANSADCYLLENRLTKRYEYIQVINNQDDLNFLNKDSIPCWSVGRLIEIISICLPAEIVISTDEYPHVLDNLMQVIEDCIDEFDFSELKE